jgi:SAM-dependent methyltransferase
VRSDREWQSWGRIDPLWSVASWPGREIGGVSPWTQEEFLALGASDFEDILRHWRHFGLVPGTCVEIGCGAGRMTAQLVKVFNTVVALDVSTDQVELARRLLGTKASAVRFYQVHSNTIPLPDSSCTGMFSSHVFQHFSAFAGVVRYLRETFRVLIPSGTVCFHVPVPGAHRRRISELRLAFHNTSVKIRRWLGMRRIMEYHRYPASTIFETLRTIGYRDTELRVFDMTSNGDAHSFFFARRP